VQLEQCFTVLLKLLCAIARIILTTFLLFTKLRPFTASTVLLLQACECTRSTRKSL